MIIIITTHLIQSLLKRAQTHPSTSQCIKLPYVSILKRNKGEILTFPLHWRENMNIRRLLRDYILSAFIHTNERFLLSLLRRCVLYLGKPSIIVNLVVRGVVQVDPPGKHFIIICNRKCSALFESTLKLKRTKHNHSAIKTPHFSCVYFHFDSLCNNVYLKW